MKVIKRKICLEDYRSRMPSVVNAINVYNSENHYDETINYTLNNQNGVISNYGGFPSDIELGDTPFSAATENGVATFKMLCKWFHFFERYYSKDYILQDGDEEYFNTLGGEDGYYWLEKNIFPSFLIPTDLQDEWNCERLYLENFYYWYTWFKERHEQYNDIEESECLEKTDCCDCSKYFLLGGNEMFELMNSWYESFLENPPKFTPIKSDVIYTKDDGVHVISKGIQTTYSYDDDGLSGYTYNFSSFIELPILFSNNIDNLGEMSIFCNDWENKYDYSNNGNNVNGGDIVIFNERIWERNGDKKGYYYSNRFKEGYFENYELLSDDEKKFVRLSEIDVTENGWEDFTLKYMNETPYEFMKWTSSTTYAYNSLNGIVFDPNPLSMSEKYNITSGGVYVVIDEILYEEEEFDYVLVGKEKKVYKVYYDSATPYFIFNNKKKYAILSTDEEGNVGYKFRMTSNLCDFEFLECGRDKFITFNGEYVKRVENFYLGREVFERYFIYDNKIMPLDEDGNVLEYYHVGKYYKLRKNTLYAIFEQQATYEDSIDERNYNLESYYTSFDDLLVYVFSKYKPIEIDIIKGRTSSKLDSFSSINTIYDDLGNELVGSYTYFEKGYPENNSCVGFLFDCGTARHLEIDEKEEYKDIECASKDSFTFELRFVNGTEDTTVNTRPNKAPTVEDLSTSGVTYYFGDLLTELEFFYEDMYGNEIISLKTNIKDSTFDTDVNGKEISSLTKHFSSITFCDMIYENNFTKTYSLSGLTESGEVTTNSEESKSASLISTIENVADNFSNIIHEVVQNDDDRVLFNENFYKHHGDINMKLKCRFTYYVGATIKREFVYNKESEDLYLYYYGPFQLENEVGGVKYTEICDITKNVEEYWLNEYMSYNVFYYGIKREAESFIYQDFSTRVATYMADFEYYVSAYDNPYTNTLINAYSNNAFFNKDNGFIYAPSIREEYKLGITTTPKIEIDGNIYIDRGIVQVIDRNIKLMDCKTMDALERFGNGYFTMK